MVLAGSVGGGDLILEAGVVLAGSLGGGGDLTFEAGVVFGVGSVFLANGSSTLFVGVGVFYMKLVMVLDYYSC